MATKTLTQVFSEIADAIRAKTESSETFTPEEMAAAIEAIQGGLAVDQDGTYYLEQGTVTDLPERLESGFFFLNTQEQQPDPVDNAVILYGSRAEAGVYNTASGFILNQIDYGIIYNGQWSEEQGVYNYNGTSDISRLDEGLYQVTDTGAEPVSLELNAYAPTNNGLAPFTGVASNGRTSDAGGYSWDGINVTRLTTGYYQVNFRNEIFELEVSSGGVYYADSSLEPFTGVANNGGQLGKGVYNWENAYGSEPEKLSNMVYDLDDSGNMRGSQQLVSGNPYIFDPGFSTGSSFRPVNNIVMSDGSVGAKGTYTWDKDSEYIEKLATGYYQINADYGSATLLDLEEAHIYQYNGSSGLVPFNGVANDGEKADDGVYVFTEDSLSWVSPGLYEVLYDGIRKLNIPESRALTYSSASGLVDFTGFAIDGEIQDGVAYNNSVADTGVYEWNADDKSIEPVVRAVIQNGSNANNGVYEWDNISQSLSALSNDRLYQIINNEANEVFVGEQTLIYSNGGSIEIVQAEDILDEPFYLQNSGAGVVYKVLVTIDH